MPTIGGLSLSFGKHCPRLDANSWGDAVCAAPCGAYTNTECAQRADKPGNLSNALAPLGAFRCIPKIK
jgi:hypothetical protein